MAIKERVLNQLIAIEDDLTRAWKTGEENAWNTMLQRMTAVRNLCREGLPTSVYPVYGEIYDGMILASQKTIEEGLKNVQEDVVFLLFELVRHVKKQVREEQHFKKEIVFLPYQAAMWDSLESVWKAAYEDKEHCNAYVMPIPYADLTPERGVAEWHCERDQFPRYVPTIDWQNIDLKAWHPDVIFFHNPYDDCNLVTSVESRYYSRNLKECTDKLVYIPYFVLSDPTDEQMKDGAARKRISEGIAHFVTTPGVMNADLTIVQSEHIRKIYIDVLTESTNVKDRVYWEKRILGIGSPKFDKVASSRREDYELPEVWKRLVDGRKVILYNTGLSAMLRHTDTYCEKICSVLDTFRERKDVVLWWRPHPLLEATFRSMRPDILKEYEQIVARYRKEGWGIFDDTSELERAIVCTDGYYGDGSSVVWLYEKSGKPIMLQDVAEKKQC